MSHHYTGTCAKCQQETTLSCDCCGAWTCFSGAVRYRVWVQGIALTLVYCESCEREVHPVQQLDPRFGKEGKTEV